MWRGGGGLPRVVVRRSVFPWHCTQGFTFYADLSIEVAPASETTMERVLQDAVAGPYGAFTLCAGDFSYAMGFSWCVWAGAPPPGMPAKGMRSLCRMRSRMWEYFLRMTEPLASAVPFMTAVGNHGVRTRRLV